MEDWRDTLPEDLKEAPALKDIPDVATLAKSLVDTQKHLGNTMGLPRQDWTPEEQEAWDKKVIEKAGGRLIPAKGLEGDAGEDYFRALGKPETPDKYSNPDDVDLTGIEGDLLTVRRNQFHKANLTDAQQKALTKQLVEEAKAMKESEQERLNDNKAKFEKEWGTNYARKKEDVIEKLKQVKAPESLITELQNDTAQAEQIFFLDHVINKLGGEGHEFTPTFNEQGLDSKTGIDLRIGEINTQIQDLRLAGDDTPIIRERIRKLTKEAHDLRVRRDSLNMG